MAKNVEPPICLIFLRGRYISVNKGKYVCMYLNGHFIIILIKTIDTATTMMSSLLLTTYYHFDDFREIGA